MEFVDLVLAFLKVQSFVFSLLYGLADGVDGFSCFEGRAKDAVLDRVDLFHELGPQFCIGLFHSKCLLKLAFGCSHGIASMTVGGAYNRIIKLGINIGYVELGPHEIVPRLLPGFDAFNDLSRGRRVLALFPKTRTRTERGQRLPGRHNHLGKNTISIFVVVEEHRHFGIVARSPIEELPEFSLHGLHFESIVARLGSC